jgi:hypothetical protein
MGLEQSSSSARKAWSTLDQLSMFAYGIGILPLIHQLKKEFPLMEQQLAVCQ